MNILSNALIISTKQKFSTEDRISVRSSMITRRLVEDLENRISPEAAGVLHPQEIQTGGETITPPPPYDLANANAVANNQLTQNEARIAEPPVSEDIKQLLSKILHAVNANKTPKNDQLMIRSQGLKCINCQTLILTPEISTCLKQNRNAHGASSLSGTYPQLPNEVLEHFSDPPRFIKALAKYQSENRKREYEEYRRRLQEESRKYEKERKMSRKGGEKSQYGGEAFKMQNLVVDTLERNLNQASNQKAIEILKNETRLPSLGVIRISPSAISKESLEAKNKTPEDDRSFEYPAKTSQDPRSRQPIGNFTSDDKLRGPIGPSQTNSSKSPKVSRQDIATTNRREISHDLVSSQRVSRHVPTMKQAGISLQDHGSSTEDTDYENVMEIQLRDYQLRTNTEVLSNSKPRNSTQATKLDDIPTRQLYACGIADKPLQETSSDRVLPTRQMSSTAIHNSGSTTCGIADKPLGANSTLSHGNQLSGKRLHSVSTSESSDLDLFNDSGDYENLNPEKWFAAWNRGCNKLSSQTSTLFGSRL